MDEVRIEPDGTAVKAFILHAVGENLDSPAQYAFDSDDGWPVEMSYLEADELVQAVKETPPHYSVPNSQEHKDRAIRSIREAQHKSNQRGV